METIPFGQGAFNSNRTPRQRGLAIADRLKARAERSWWVASGATNPSVRGVVDLVTWDGQGDWIGAGKRRCRRFASGFDRRIRPVSPNAPWSQSIANPTGWEGMWPVAPGESSQPVLCTAIPNRRGHHRHDPAPPPDPRNCHCPPLPLPI